MEIDMRNTFLAVTSTAALLAPALASAQKAPEPDYTFGGNMTVASEYLYRGIAQTRGKPALQGGYDFSHKSGLYLGAWGSNISWISDAVPGASSSLEVDVYGGFKGSITSDLGFDVGVLTYNYPGSGKPTGNAKPDTIEIYGGLSYQMVSVKYSHTTGSLFGWTQPDGSKTSGSGYLDIGASFDLGNGLSIAPHVGHQTVKGLSDASYTDYKIGLNKEFPLGTVGVAYSATNAKGDCSKGEPYCFVNANGNGYDAGKGRLVVSFSKSF